MPSFFQNKVVWITGASSGIGEALALDLAAQGAKLIVSARRTDELHRVANLTQLPAANVLVLPMDMTDEASFPTHVQTVLTQFGHIDYLFQNAGISQRSTVIDTDFTVYRQLMELNFFGVVALTKAVLPSLLAQGNGHFVVTSSVSGKIGVKLRSGYCASKHALHGFFDSLRAETSEHGLRVTIVCPGYIRTPISLNALTAQGEKHNKMDMGQQQGMDVHVFAKKLLKAVAGNREEVYIGGSELVGIYLKRFWPSLLSRILEKRQGA